MITRLIGLILGFPDAGAATITATLDATGTISECLMYAADRVRAEPDVTWTVADVSNLLETIATEFTCSIRELEI
jgi:hypothetical protein